MGIYSKEQTGVQESMLPGAIIFSSLLYSVVDMTKLNFWGPVIETFVMTSVLFLVVRFVFNRIIPAFHLIAYKKDCKLKFLHPMVLYMIVALYLNIISLILIYIIVSATLHSETGLWIEKLMGQPADRYYYFHPIVGGSGIYISLTSYFTYKILAKINQKSTIKNLGPKIIAIFFILYIVAAIVPIFSDSLGLSFIFSSLIVFYLSFKYRRKRKKNTSILGTFKEIVAWKEMATLIPLLMYLAILYWHNFIPTPYFNG